MGCKGSAVKDRFLDSELPNSGIYKSFITCRALSGFYKGFVGFHKEVGLLRFKPPESLRVWGA